MRTVYPFILTFSEEENIKRFDKDNRTTEQKQRANDELRKDFDNIPFIQIDKTEFSASEDAEYIIK